MQRITRSKLDQIESGIASVGKRAESFRGKVSALCTGDYRVADEAKIMKLAKARNELADAVRLLESARDRVSGARF